MNDSVTEVTSTDKETGPQVIKAENPSTEEMKQICENIKVNYDSKVNTKPVQFNFRKSKDKETGIETVREAVVLPVPYPSIEGIVAILEAGGKQLELLQEAVENVVNAAVREILSDDTTVNASNFDANKVSWETIANTPKVQRRGGGIPKETWEAFAQDYVEVMPAITGKTIEQVANAAKILVGKLQAVRTNEPVLQLLVQQLAIYAENTPNMEEYSDCVEFLLNKADQFLNVTEEELLANL